MIDRANRTLIGAAIGLALARVATAQLDPNLTPPEFKCQASVDKAGGKYMKALAKCEISCIHGFYRGGTPSSDCFPPYGGATAICVTDALKGADAKFRAAIAKGCDSVANPGANCPECYDAGGGFGGCGAAGYATAHQQDFGTQFASIASATFCKTSAAFPNEQLCQRNTTKVASKFLAALYNCYGKCFRKANTGAMPGADCEPNPILPNDVPTQDCIAVAELKSETAFDELCAAAGVNILCPRHCDANADCDSAPMAGDGNCSNNNCDAGNTATTAYPSGNMWTALLEAATAGNIVDSNLGADTGIFCSQ